MMQHVRARATEDIDALLIVPQIAMPGLFEALSKHGFSVDATENIRQFRDEGMTAFSFGGVAVNLLRPVIPAYAHVLDRAVSTVVEGQRVSLASPEGLIVTKLLAMRLRDEHDIADLFQHTRASSTCSSSAPSWSPSRLGMTPGERDLKTR